MTGQLARTEEPMEAVTLLSVIQTAARDPNVDVGKMKDLLAMYKELQAEKAQVAFNQAMNRAQSKMGRIAADSNNPQTKSQYASYAGLDRVLRPLYVAEGFSLSFDNGESPADMVRVLCHVSHAAGHTRTYHTDMPADGKGAKGGDVMTKTHAAGAAMTYGMRYLLKMIFNVAIGEDDKDGNEPLELITEEQAATLQDLIDATGSDKAKFLSWLKVDSLASIPAQAYDHAKKALQAKERK